MADPNVLKEMARKVQGLPPSVGMEKLLSDEQFRKLDPQAPLPKPSKQQQPPHQDKDKDKDKEKPPQPSSSTKQKKKEQKKSTEKKVTSKKTPSFKSIQSSSSNEGASSDLRYRCVDSDRTEMFSSFGGVEIEELEEALEPYSEFEFDQFRELHKLVTKCFDDNHVVPEVVVVGKIGGGKSSLVEAFLGYKVNCVKFDEKGHTKVPVFFHLHSDEECDQPHLSIQVPPDKKLTPMPINEISEELESCFEGEWNAASQDPINIHFNYELCFNMRIIDTPGIHVDSYFESLVQLLAPPNRLIVVVSEAKMETEFNEGEQLLWDAISAVDPYGNRTLKAFTHFNCLLDELSSKPNSSALANWVKMNQHQHQGGGCIPSFWISLLSLKERMNGILYERIGQAQRADLATFRNLGGPKDAEQFVGLLSLRRTITRWCWTKYFEAEMPRLQAGLLEKENELNKMIDDQREIKEKLDLRSLAAKHVALYVRYAQEVVRGNAKGNAAVNGETLAEERDAQVLMVSSTDWELLPPSEVPLATERLFGGVQFERLFREFIKVMAAVKIEESDVDEMNTNDAKKYLWAACDLVQVKSEDLLIPVLDQLVERVAGCLRKIPAIVEGMLDSRNLLPNPREKMPIPSKHFQPLTTYLGDQFTTYVDKLSERSKGLCMEELYSTKTIAWHVASMDNIKTDLQPLQLVRNIFDITKRRIVINVLRKLYNLFIMKFMDPTIWNEIQTHIYCLDQPTLEEVFEVHSIDDQVENEEGYLEGKLEENKSDQQVLENLAPLLQFPKIVEGEEGD